jgi:hypothetical protein
MLKGRARVNPRGCVYLVDARFCKMSKCGRNLALITAFNFCMGVAVSTIFNIDSPLLALHQEILPVTKHLRNHGLGFDTKAPQAKLVLQDMLTICCPTLLVTLALATMEFFHQENGFLVLLTSCQLLLRTKLGGSSTLP